MLFEVAPDDQVPPVARRLLSFINLHGYDVDQALIQYLQIDCPFIEQQHVPLISEEPPS